MKELKVINSQEILGKDFKIYGDYQNPLFLAKDVASWIEHTDLSRMVDMIDDDEKLKRTLYTSGQNREMWFVTEDGLYEILMQSRKPIAKAFKKQVKAILKDIRKHGLYATDDLIANPDIAIAIFTALKKEREEKALLEFEIKTKDQLIGELQPKADYVDDILNNNALVTITQIAKDYGMSGRKMNQLLHDLKVQYSQSGQWLLYHQHHGQGYTHSETINITRSDGRTDVKMETKWTQKGRLFIYNLLKSNGILPLIEQNYIA